MIDRDVFVEQVHSALAHLYDHAYLQGHPLAQPLASRATPDDRGRALRRLLLHAIQDLKPPPEAPRDSPGWRHYEYLYLRYVEAKPVAEIAGGLAVTERQTRRRHRDALAALARVLWDQWRSLADPSGEPGLVPAHEISMRVASPLETELRRMGGASTGATDVVDVIDGARGIVGHLAERHAVRVTFTPPEAAAPVLGDPVLLRQAIVGALVYAIHRAAGRSIALSAASDRSRTTISLRIPHMTSAASSNDPRGELEDVGRLLDTQQGNLQLRQEADDLVVELSLISARPRSILVVDDNPDMCQLYRRYLRDSGFQVIEARSGDAALSLLDELRPAGIVLDVMLPVRDGWDILQALRGRPGVGDVPVLVCSVLQQRELALSLGATDFLAKPITQSALLEALARCFEREAPARSGTPGRSASAR